MKPANLKKLNNALIVTWNYISADAPDPMYGEDVCEMVLDADRLESFGGCDKDILKEFRALSYEAQMKIALKTFPANHQY